MFRESVTSFIIRSAGFTSLPIRADKEDEYLLSRGIMLSLFLKDQNHAP
jgi:hypothetical protein